MSERYPGYDVLAKRHTPSWNEKTRQVIDARLALPREPRYLSQEEWLVLEAYQNNDTCHLHGTARMGDDPRTSVVNGDCRSWDIPNLWICDGSVFPTVGGVNPSLTIQAIACRTADRIRALASRGEL